MCVTFVYLFFIEYSEKSIGKVQTAIFSATTNYTWQLK